MSVALGILITILKIIGYILLVLLAIVALVLVLVIIVLAMPIRYNFLLNKDEKLKMEVFVSWFFGALKIRYKREDKTIMQVKLFGRVIMGEGKKEKKPKRRKNKKRRKTDRKLVKPAKAPPVLQKADETKLEDIIIEDTIIEEIEKPKLREINEIKPEPIAEQAKEKKNKEKKVKKAKPIKTEKEPSKVKEYLNYALEYPYKEQLFLAIKKLLKRIFKALKPKRFKVVTLIGTEDPSETGKIIGYIYTFRGIVGADINATGDFDKPVFEIKVNIAGRIILGEFIMALILFALTKPIRVLILKYLKGRKKK